MMNLRQLVSLLLFLAFQQVQAQGSGERMVWYFGDKAGIDFNGGSPAVLTNGQMYAPEGCAVANDANGNLLFYTNGNTVWNRNHQVMPNGTGLKGSLSSTQSCLIVQKPSNAYGYYIFTTSGMEEKGDSGMRYTTVDMTLDGGLGDVVVAFKNRLLFKPSMEMLAAVRNANGSDYWILGRESKGNNYRAYMLTSSGLYESSPVISAVGLKTTATRFGSICFSKDGRKMAATLIDHSTIEMYDFNNATGEVSNVREITGPYGSVYSVRFSPNSRFLYTCAINGTFIFQFDTWRNYLPDMIANMKTLRFQGNAPFSMGTMELGPAEDDIYIARIGSRRISRIPNPDVLAPMCELIDTAVLFPKAVSYAGLPNFPVAHIRTDGFIYLNPCVGQATKLMLQNGQGLDSVKWTFGDGMIQTQYAPFDTLLHKYPYAGLFKAQVLAYSNGITHSMGQQNILIRNLPYINDIGSDTTACNGESILLKVNTTPGCTWAWQDGDTSAIYKVRRPGTYWVSVYDGYCYNTDTIVIGFDPAKYTVDLGPDTFLCDGEIRLLDAGFTDGIYLWQDNSTQRSYAVGQTGLYWVKVARPGYTCAAYDSVQIKFHPQPQISLGADRELCAGDIVLFDLRNKGYQKIWWNDGSTDSVYHVNKTGTYMVKVMDAFCLANDTVSLNFHPIPAVELPASFNLCKGDSIEIDLRMVAGEVLWQDGYTKPLRYIKTGGNFHVSYSDSVCRSDNAFTVQLKFKPDFYLPDDTILCEGKTVWLDPGKTDGTYLWQDGSTRQAYEARAWGRYYVTAQNNCGAKSDTVDVLDCTCELFVPTAFTPNTDYVNEGFKPVGCVPNTYHISIYNRWGELVFESDDISKAWDGTFKGKTVPQDVFVWMISYARNSLSNTANKSMRGTVTLLR